MSWLFFEGVANDEMFYVFVDFLCKITSYNKQLRTYIYKNIYVRSNIKQLIVII